MDPRPRTGLEERVKRVDLLGLSSQEFEAACLAFLKARSEPAYRLEQLREWIYRRTPADLDSMSDLPKNLRQSLDESFLLHPLQKLSEQRSADGTRKFLWTGSGGWNIESVIIPERERVTYCISTQAGCPVKCTFCATGFGGFQGQLAAAEIVDQVLLMRHLSALPPTNIVFMGMGEPLLNFPEVVRSLGILTHSQQVGFGARRITVSTVGIPARIRELGSLFPQVKLALSLHATRDDLRSEIIPLNRQFPLREVLAAVADHAAITSKMATFEYIVLPGVNDSRADAREVAAVAAKIPSRLNLIGYNKFPGGAYEKPSVRRLLTFRRWLNEDFRGEVTIRRSRGEDILGACGQLSLRNVREGASSV